MSIFIDKNKLFLIEITGNYVFDNFGNNIGFKIKKDGDVRIKAVSTGRDFERMSRIIEEASIINHVTGKPLLRSSVFCKMIVSVFFNELLIESTEETNHIVINNEVINSMQYDLVKSLAQKWLEVTDGG